MRTVIVEDSAAAADVRAGAGVELRLRARVLSLPRQVVVEEAAARRLAELRAVVAGPVHGTGRRVEYRMWNGVRAVGDGHLSGLALRYELTQMNGRPLGAEAAKTFGHVHVRPSGVALGYPEIVEVLHGRALFLIQDLRPSPEAGRESDAAAGHRERRSVGSWLVRVGAGERIVLPPELAHVTIDAGRGPLVFSDIIDRRARGIYDEVRAAHGFAWFVGSDGALARNPSYGEAAEPLEVSAAEWSGELVRDRRAGHHRSLYDQFRDDPTSFAWLSEPTRFPAVAPALWARIEPLIR